MNLDQMLEHDFLFNQKIPDQMPNSTMVCPPTVQFAKQYQSKVELKNRLEATTPLNLMMSTRGPIAAKLENSNDLML